MISSGPGYSPKTLVCISIPRATGSLNQARSKTGSGSQAPKKCHCPST